MQRPGFRTSSSPSSMTTRNYWLVVVLTISAFLIGAANAEIGILRITTVGDESSAKEFCVGYAPGWGGGVVTKPTQTFLWSPVLAAPFNACSALPLIPRRGEGERVLLIAERGNCTFLSKAENANASGAEGLVVINNVPDDGVLQPSMGNNTSNHTSNFTVVGLRYRDRERFLSMVNESTGRQQRIALYSPSVFPLDPNVIVVFLISVGMVVISSYWANSSERLHSLADDEESDDEEGGRAKKQSEEDEHEVFEISGKFALFFAISACCVIVLMYFLYYYLAYIVIGIFVLGATSSLHMLAMSFGNAVFRTQFKRATTTALVDIPLCGTVSLCSLVVLFLSSIPPILWFIFRNQNSVWVLQDLLGMSIIATVIRTAKLPSLKIATLLLGLFFMYDVFFVFITPLFTNNGDSIMEKVATGEGSGSSERLPLALIFPRMFDKYGEICGSQSFSMIGYGDIVIPALLVSYCLKVDYHVLSSNPSSRKKNSLRVYYLSVSIGYAAGLLLTYLGLIVLKSAQPALFYLVPSTLSIVSFQGWRRGELSLLWHGVDYRKEHSEPGLTPLEDRGDKEEEEGIRLHEMSGSINGEIPLQEDEDRLSTDDSNL